MLQPGSGIRSPSPPPVGACWDLVTLRLWLCNRSFNTGVSSTGVTAAEHNGAAGLQGSPEPASDTCFWILYLSLWRVSPGEHSLVALGGKRCRRSQYKVFKALVSKLLGVNCKGCLAGTARNKPGNYPARGGFGVHPTWNSSQPIP